MVVEDAEELRSARSMPRAARRTRDMPRSDNGSPGRSRRPISKVIGRPIAILELEGRKAGSWEDRGAPYPHVVALAYRDGRPPVAWLVANQRYWTDRLHCEGCRAGEARDASGGGCLNAVDGLGLCPARAAARIREATQQHWVLSSDGWNAAAWLGELFKAGGMDEVSFQVVDLFNWSQRIGDRQVRRRDGARASSDASEEDRLASCALLILRTAPVLPGPRRNATVTTSGAAAVTSDEDG